MRTPEQITKTELENIGLDNVNDIDDWDHLERIVALVIEADRAQRRLPYDTAELQGAIDNNDPVQLLEIVNDIHTYQFYTEEEED